MASARAVPALAPLRVAPEGRGRGWERAGDEALLGELAVAEEVTAALLANNAAFAAAVRAGAPGAAARAAARAVLGHICDTGGIGEVRGGVPTLRLVSGASTGRGSDRRAGARTRRGSGNAGGGGGDSWLEDAAAEDDAKGGGAGGASFLSHAGLARGVPQLRDEILSAEEALPWGLVRRTWRARRAGWRRALRGAATTAELARALAELRATLLPDALAGILACDASWQAAVEAIAGRAGEQDGSGGGTMPAPRGAGATADVTTASAAAAAADPAPAAAAAADPAPAAAAAADPAPAAAAADPAPAATAAGVIPAAADPAPAEGLAPELTADPAPAVAGRAEDPVDGAPRGKDAASTAPPEASPEAALVDSACPPRSARSPIAGALPIPPPPPLPSPIRVRIDPPSAVDAPRLPAPGDAPPCSPRVLADLWDELARVLRIAAAPGAREARARDAALAGARGAAARRALAALARRARDPAGCLDEDSLLQAPLEAMLGRDEDALRTLRELLARERAILEGGGEGVLDLLLEQGAAKRPREVPRQPARADPSASRAGPDGAGDPGASRAGPDGAGGPGTSSGPDAGAGRPGASDPAAPSGGGGGGSMEERGPHPPSARPPDGRPSCSPAGTPVGTAQPPQDPLWCSWSADFDSGADSIDGADSDATDLDPDLDF